MRKTVVCQLALGRTRVSGYTLYDHDSMAFEETTPRDVKRLIKEGVVNGLRLDKQGQIQLDEKGFNCKNLLVKSGVGNYRPLIPSVDLLCNGMFALTKVACTDDGLVYEIVSNECARLPITEQKLRSLYNVGCLYGCWINEDSGMIEFAKGVEMLDMTSEAIQERLRQEAKVKEEAENGSNDVPVSTGADTGKHPAGSCDPCSDSVTPESDINNQDFDEAGPGGSNGSSGAAEEIVTEVGETPEAFELAEGEQTLDEMLGINPDSGVPAESSEVEEGNVFVDLETMGISEGDEPQKAKTPKKSGKGKAKKAK